MHFRCQQEELLTAVSLAEKAVSTQDTIQHLKGIQILVEQSQLTLTATNLDVSIQTKLPIQTISEGRVVVEGKLLAGILHRMPKAMVHVHQQDTNIEIQANDVVFHLNQLSHDELPSLPELPEASFSLPIATFRSMVKRTIVATAAENPQRPFTTGLFFEKNKGKLRLVGTDSNRLAVCDVTMDDANEESLQLLLLAKTMKELASMLPGGTDGCISVHNLPEQVAFCFGETIFMSQKLDIPYPDYQRIIPGEQPIKVVVNRTNLIGSLERASLISTVGFKPVILSVADSTLQIQTQRSDRAQHDETLAVEHEGQDGKAAYSIPLLLDMLKVETSENVVFSFNTDLLQSTMKPDGRDDYLYVIMPIMMDS